MLIVTCDQSRVNTPQFTEVGIMGRYPIQKKGRKRASRRKLESLFIKDFLNEVECYWTQQQ